jgi:hypothetical protein
LPLRFFLLSDVQRRNTALKSYLTILALVMLCVLSGCGNQPAGGGSGETFSVEVTGDTSFTFSNSDGTARLGEDTSTGSSIYTLQFVDKESTRTVAILFYTAKPTAGTHKITSSLETANTIQALVTSNVDGLKSYATAEGTLTLTAVGDTLSGSFEFTATGGAIGVSDKQVTAKVTFSNVK